MATPATGARPAATRDPAAGTAIAEAWRPWRGYAVFKLWLSLETP